MKYFFEDKFTSEDINELIVNYYNATQFLYNILWMTNNSLAMHYGIWDKDTKKLNDAQLNENRIIAQLLHLEPSDIIMDAGCGVCGTSIWMAQNYNCKAIGFTICKKQVEQANKIIKLKGLEQLVQVDLKDIINTGYPSEYFTKIFGIESICYTPDQKIFAYEAFRLLKHGGCFIRVDGFLTSKDLTPYAKKIFSEWCEGWAVPGLGTLKDYEEILKKVGFINVKSTIVTEKIIKSAKKIWWVNVPFYIPFFILYKLKLLPKENYMDVLASLNQKDLFCRGITSYVIITADKP